MSAQHMVFEDQVKTAIADGRAALAAVNVPELVIASPEDMQVHASPFTAALLVSALLAGRDPAFQEIYRSHVRYLLDTMEPPGFWPLSKDL
ncbi:MAG: hypothetical protein L0387_34610 [Acidobacteria bacterium]|nr:hypothetical protein [Acidobacteriota bacterium]